MSVTDLSYNQKNKSLEGAVKLFINDLEDALKRLNKQQVDLLNIKDTAKVNKLFFDYLTTRLKLKLNSKPLTYQYLGFEKEQEAIWIYFEVKSCELPKRIEIENALLYDFLTNQFNIIHCQVGETKKSTKLNYPDKVTEIYF